MVEAERDAALAGVGPGKRYDVGADQLPAPDFLRQQNILPVGIDDAGLVLRPRLDEDIAGMVALIGFFAGVTEGHLDLFQVNTIAPLLARGLDTGVLQRLVLRRLLLRRIEDQNALVDGRAAFGAGTGGEEVLKREGGVGGIDRGHDEDLSVDMG